MATFTNNRGLRSEDMTKYIALPAAAATANSASIDLGTDPATHGTVLEGRLEIYLPATPSLVDAKTVIITLQDSADDSSFAAVTGVGTVTATGAGGVGAAAITREVPIPTILRRYVRISIAVLTAGGDNTAVSARLAFLYEA